MQHIQSILDDKKGEISSGAYLELSNALMAEHKVQEKGFYRIGYIYCKPELEDDTLELLLRYQECIIQLRDEQANKIITSLINYHYSCVHLHSMGHHDDTDDEDEEESFVKLPDQNRTTTFNIPGCCNEAFHTNGESKSFTAMTKCKIVYIKRIE